MGISLFSMTAISNAGKTPGSVWQPKSQRLRVGGDIGALTATSFADDTRRTVVLSRGDDVRFTSEAIFAAARGTAQSGGGVKNFRAVNVDHFTKPSRASDGTITGGTPETNRAGVMEFTPLYMAENKLVTFRDGTLRVSEKTEDGTYELTHEFAVRDDARLRFDADGNPVFEEGAAARKGGKLVSAGGGDILVRMTDADVDAQGASTVLNLSSKAGSFAGGGVTYLGAYAAGSSFDGANGKNVYAGYFFQSEFLGEKSQGVFSGVFEEVTIEAGDAADEFSGYFSKSRINAGEGKNVFSGMFLGGNEVMGGGDADGFYGRFIDSVVNGGDGDDVYGSRLNLNTMKRILTDKKGEDGKDEYRGLESDFVNSDISAGNGRNRVLGMASGGSITFGDGENSLSGVFSRVTVKGGDGGTSVRAMYSEYSVFDTGGGENEIDLATAFGNTVNTGTGRTSVSLGRNTGNGDFDGESLGGTGSLGDIIWKTADQEQQRLDGRNHGELGSNHVNAELGENAVRVNNGVGVQTGFTGTKDPRETGGAEEENKAEKNEAVSSAASFGSDPGLALARENAENEAALLGVGLPETGAERRKRQTAARRYAGMSGEAPESGVLAATVSTGAGEDLRFEAVRFAVKDAWSEEWIRRSTRRSDGATGWRFTESLF